MILATTFKPVSGKQAMMRRQWMSILDEYNIHYRKRCIFNYQMHHQLPNTPIDDRPRSVRQPSDSAEHISTVVGWFMKTWRSTFSRALARVVAIKKAFQRKQKPHQVKIDIHTPPGGTITIGETWFSFPNAAHNVASFCLDSPVNMFCRDSAF